MLERSNDGTSIRTILRFRSLRTRVGISSSFCGAVIFITCYQREFRGFIGKEPVCETYDSAYGKFTESTREIQNRYKRIIGGTHEEHRVRSYSSSKSGVSKFSEVIPFLLKSHSTVFWQVCECQRRAVGIQTDWPICLKSRPIGRACSDKYAFTYLLLWAVSVFREKRHET